MINTINGQTVYTIDKTSNHIVVVDYQNGVNGQQKEIINLVNPAYLHVHISLSDIEQWALDMFPDSDLPFLGGYIILYVRERAPFGTIYRDAFGVFDVPIINVKSYNEGDCVRVDIPLNNLNLSFGSDSPKLDASIYSDVNVQYLAFTKFPSMDTNSLSTSGIIPTNLAQQMGVPEGTGNGFNLHIHDFYFSDGTNILNPEVVDDEFPEGGGEFPEGGGEFPEGDGSEGESSGSGLEIKDYDCSMFSTKYLSTNLQEYRESLPNELTFEFFYDYYFVNTTLMEISNLNGTNGFTIELLNKAISDTSKLLELVVTYYSDGVKISNKLNIDGVDTIGNNHIVMEIDTSGNMINVILNKIQTVSMNVPNNKLISTGLPLSVNILSQDYNMDSYKATMNTPDGDLFIPSAIPSVKSTSEWEDLYTLVSANDYSVDFTDYGTTDFIQQTISDGTTRYVGLITNSDQSVVRLKDHTTRSWYYGFDENPIALQLILEIDGFRSLGDIFIEISSDTSDNELYVSSWNLPFDPYEMSNTETIAFSIPLSEDIGNISSIKINIDNVTVVKIIDITFCGRYGKLTPTPLYIETAW